LIIFLAGFSQTVNAQRIIAAEYFYNTDPGVGNGTPITFNATSGINTTFHLPTTGLAGGVQQLFVRFKDSLNRWSVAEQRTFYINATSGVVTPLSAITNAEYFFDTDPGAGKGKPITITKNDSLLITPGIPTTGLLKGPHQLFIRFKDSLKRWSIAEQRLLYVDSFPVAATMLSPIIKGEYFYDTDPGAGHGTAINVTQNDSLAFTTGTSTETLLPGTHQLFIRFRDSLGRWGIAEQRTFLIDGSISAPVVIAPVTTGEYFIDTDPGTGKATALTITKADSLNVQFHLASTTKPGVHQLFIRLKDSLNRWGIAEQRTFFVDSALAQPKLAPIVAAEYFINVDTGVGRGTPIPITKADSINKVLQVTLPASIQGGTNYLYIRFKDSTGKWSIAEQRTLPAIVCKPDLGPDTTVTICAGTTVSVKAIYAYKGFASSVWSTPTPDSVSVGVYTLIVTSSQGCKDTVVVTVKNYPKPHLGNDTTIIITNNTIKKDLTTLYNTTGLQAQYSTTTPQSAGAGTYTLIVTDDCGFKDTATIVITLYVPPPVISSFSPSYSGAGATITITGKYFTGATVVSFGGTPASYFTIVNDSVITAVTGAGSSGVILVTTPGGTATKGGFVICTPVAPYATVTASKASPICTNVKVTFTATPANGGTAPAYQWYKNNNTVGTNSATYSDSTLKNSDSVWCVITSNASCLAAPTGKSNVLVYTVNNIATPSVTVAADNASPICNATKVTFTATAVNGGTTPVYQWYKNNAAVGTNAVTYVDSLLKNSDSVWSVVTSNVACATATSAKSNVLKYVVNTSVTASVSITANPSAATCQGTPVTFTAVAVNGGTTPVYQWRKGSANVGGNSPTYTDTLPVNGDSITVILTTSNACAVSHTVNSNGIKLTVNARPNLGRDTSVNTCAGTAINIRNLYNTTGLTPTWTTARPDSVVASGIYTLTVANASGCKDTAVVTVGYYAKPSLGRDTTILTCPGTAANIKNIYTTTGLTTTWSTTRPDSVKAGLYMLTVANGSGCKDTALVTIAYYTKPNLGNDTTVIVASNTATTDLTRLYNVTGLTAQYSAATPTAAGAGTYTLIVTNNCSLKDTAVIKVIVVTSPPIITSFTPVSTYTGGNVTINGKYFTGATVVSFGGVAAAHFTVLNDSVIAAAVNTGASGSVLVTTPGGTATKAGFTICSAVTPSVTITASKASPICVNTKVTFTASPVNGGTAPRYQWYKNNTAVGTNANTYSDSLLNNSDSVWCIVTSNAACIIVNTVKSNALKYVVNPLVTPLVSIAANLASPICSGTKVTFTATAVNGGTLPVYQWYKNNIAVGANSNVYADSLLKTNDSVWCIVTSNAACLAATSAKSNVLKYAVSLYAITSVSITASPASTVCAGSPVTFTATPSGGGTAPVYQWKKNGVNVGINSATYVDSLPVNGDSVYVTLTSSVTCVTKRTASSNGIKLTVNAKPNLGNDITVSTCPGTAANISNLYNLTGYKPSWSTARPDSVTVPGAYTLIVVNGNGCRDTAIVTLSNYAKPNLGHDTSVYICPGSVINLATVYKTTGLTTAWSTPKPDIAQAGHYTLIVTNTTGCKDTAVVTVSNYVKPNLGNDTTVLTCPGTARNINAVYNLTGLTPLWSTTRPDSVVTGSYTLRVTNTTGCKDTAVITVGNYAKPNLGNDTTVSTCLGTAINIKGVYNLTGLTPAWSTARPDSITNAGAYTVTVTNSTGCKDTGIITVSNYPKPTLGKDTAVTVCPGTPVNLQAYYNVTGLKTSWSVTRPDSVTRAGSYTLIVSSTHSCKDTAVITIKNFPKPALGKDSTVYTCLGTSINITGLYSLTGLTPTWSIARPDSIVTAGTYTLVVKNSNSCKDTALVTVVTPAPPAKPSIKIEGGTTFCLGDSLALVTNPAAGSLQWFRNNGAIRQATSGTYQVRLGGNYKVRLTTGTNGVCNVMSDSVTVIVNQVVTPSITMVGDSLVSSSPSGNQWFEDGVLVPGATGQKYSPVNIDQYTVQVTSGNCTSAMSSPYIYTAGTNLKKVATIGIEANANVLVYPNPAQYGARLQISGFTSGVVATITDLQGRVVWQQDKLANGTYTLPIENFASGLYLVIVKDRYVTKTLKLVRAK